MEWYGIDGSVWDLNDWRSGIQIIRGAVQGLHFPSAQPQVSAYAGLHGQRRRGVHIDPREISWPLLIWSDSSAAWLESARKFWDSFGLLEPGRWRVATPDGNARSIACVLNSDGGHTYDLDPVGNGWALYTLALTADNPFWESAPITDSWSNQPPVDFFDPAGSPPFHISPASTLDSATLSNPGDVEAWPTWQISAGPDAVHATITVGGGTLTTPAIPAGRTLAVDTDPFVQSAVLDDGTNVWPAMGWDPRPIPPGGQVPLELQLDRAGSIACSITPRHYRML